MPDRRTLLAEAATCLRYADDERSAGLAQAWIEDAAEALEAAGELRLAEMLDNYGMRAIPDVLREIESLE